MKLQIRAHRQIAADLASGRSASGWASWSLLRPREGIWTRAMPGSSKVADSGARTLLDQFRSGPMAGVSEIVFAARKQNQTDGHWYANIGYYAHDPAQGLARGNQAHQVDPGDRQAGDAGGRSPGWSPRPPGQLRWQDDSLQLSQGGNRGVPPVRDRRRRLGPAPAHRRHLRRLRADLPAQRRHRVRVHPVQAVGQLLADSGGRHAPLRP